MDSDDEWCVALILTLASWSAAVVTCVCPLNGGDGEKYENWNGSKRALMIDDRMIMNGINRRTFLQDVRNGTLQLLARLSRLRIAVIFDRWLCDVQPSFKVHFWRRDTARQNRARGSLNKFPAGKEYFFPVMLWYDKSRWWSTIVCITVSTESWYDWVPFNTKCFVLNVICLWDLTYAPFISKPSRGHDLSDIW